VWGIPTGAFGGNPMSNVVVSVPAQAWDLMLETLHMDSQSSFFDDDLRKKITEALESIIYVGGESDE